MISKHPRRVVVMAMAAAATLAAVGFGTAYGHGDEHDAAYGKPGDPKKPARIVQVVMREADGKMLFIPDQLRVKKGEQIRFMLRNNGEVDHEFVIGTVEDNLNHMKEMEKN
ncbi:MAG: copper resistance protein, partial [Reyranella sp.]|nr:copper resistance protein [Reyranella sp.]